MSDWFERHIRRKPEPLPPNATRDGLLRAVVDAPDDEGPRWVYSDYLMARALLDSPHLGDLEQLSLRRNEIPDGEAVGLRERFGARVEL